jgi:hypothetical protein
LYLLPLESGKTLIARRLAQASGMDYALMSGGDVGPLGEDAVSTACSDGLRGAGEGCFYSLMRRRPSYRLEAPMEGESPPLIIILLVVTEEEEVM